MACWESGKCCVSKTEVGSVTVGHGAVHRLRPKLMTVTAVLASLIPILSKSGVGSDVMEPIAAPIVGGMITSTIHVLILVPVFFVMTKTRAHERGTLRSGLPLQPVPPLRRIAGLVKHF